MRDGPEVRPFDPELARRADDPPPTLRGRGARSDRYVVRLLLLWPLDAAGGPEAAARCAHAGRAP